jgi:hypothetical protein
VRLCYSSFFILHFSFEIGRAASLVSLARVGLSTPSPSRCALRWFRYYPSRGFAFSFANLAQTANAKILDTMNIASEIQQMLLIGAGNSKATSPQLQALLAQYADTNLAEAPANVQLLSASAILALLNKAATTNPSAPIAKEQNEEEEDRLPICPAELIDLLGYILRNNEEEIIAEFVAHFDCTRWRLPDFLLPDFLNVGYKKKSLQKDIHRIIGSRGQWLAAQNPQWAYIEQIKPETAPKTTSTPSKLNALRAEAAKKYLIFDETWQINLPDELDDELKACQLRPNAHTIEGGEKANYILQLLAATPPTHWLQNNLKYKTILHETRKSEWIVAIVGGLLQAAEDFGDQYLLVELHKFHLSTHNFKLWNSIKTTFLASSLSPQNHQQIGFLYLEDAEKNLSDAHPFITFMMQSPTWSIDLAIATLTLIVVASEKDNYHLYYGLRALMQRAAFCLPVEALADLKKLWEPIADQRNQNWQRDFTRLFQTLSRRARIAAFYR